jgi:regulator of replication initiation timing
MDSEMFGDYSYLRCKEKSPLVPVFLGGNSKKKQDIWDQLEKVSSKLDVLEASIANRVKQDVLPILTEFSSARKLEDSKMEEIVALVNDLKQLKQDMKDGQQKQFPAKVDDAPAIDAKHVLEGHGEQRRELADLQEDVCDLKKDLQQVMQNIGNLFAFVYGKERGKQVQLKGGMQGDRLVIHMSRGP